jgi:hypothetical protein
MVISAGFALELFWFLATGNTDFLFPSFRLRFFQFKSEGFAQDFTIASVTGIKFFSLASLCSLQY